MLNIRGHNRPPFRPEIPGTDLRSPDVPMAIIYRPSRSATQSAPQPRHWILEFEPAASSEIDPLMGWTASRAPYRSIRLSFPDRESAIDYAEKRDWPYILRDGHAGRPPREPLFRPLERLDGPQPRGRGGGGPRPADCDVDPVILAAQESFPASDPPAWTGTTLSGG